MTKKCEALVKILSKTVKLNPYYRWTAFESLKMPIFNQYRNTTKEAIIKEMRTVRQLE